MRIEAISRLHLPDIDFGMLSIRIEFGFENRTELIPFPCNVSLSTANAKSSTLPLPPHRPLSTIRDKERDRDRDGYYSDRNELIRERERERDRGYLSDHNSRLVK